jgi:hypothetical protein
LPYKPREAMRVKSPNQARESTMSIIAFGTLAYAKKPKEAGIPAEQAEVQTTVLADALKAAPKSSPLEWDWNG